MISKPLSIRYDWTKTKRLNELRIKYLEIISQAKSEKDPNKQRRLLERANLVTFDIIDESHRVYGKKGPVV